ncbi:MAG: CotH kinase family protein [Bacteroidetes bacterium]|nr:CotH kinase family protein [Bacteroidota bacterium]
MNRLHIAFVCVVAVILNTVTAQTFYNTANIQKIEVQFSQPNWDYMLDTAKLGKENYIMAQWVKINGTYFDSVGVKYKGNSSYDSTYKKNPIHIELNTYKSQSYQGYKDVKLSNGYADPSLVREVLAYDILKNYMHCPQANFAQVYINGTYMGVYSNAENIDKKFVSDHFYSSNNTFVKCNPIGVATTNTKSNLRYITGADSSGYFNFYEMKSNYGWNQLKDLCDSVTNNANSIPNVMDLDRAIWMLAYNNVIVNLDSYSGAFAQNYYLYKDNTGHFNPIIWDLNMSFAGFPHLGFSNSSMASLSITNLQQMPTNIHSTDQYWPLIKNIMSNAQYKRMYIAHMKTILNEMIVSGAYATKATAFQSVIDTAVQSDNNKFFTYSQFQNAMTSNISVGSYSVPGISTLMNARAAYLNGTSEFTVTAPTITSATSIATPSLNAAVTITANVSNANGVYLGYRFANTLKFQRISMYDDGLHNDGASGDNVFGVTFTMTGSQAQYYVYAENNNAGKFAPERAEHEFYSLVAIQTATVGQVKINEFMADNQDDVQNEFNQYEDWIELHNTTSTPLELSGLFLTDNFASPSKFTIPQNTIIQPNGYLIIWADENPSTASYVHANFKLAAAGEQIMLSNSTGAVLDSISYGVQQTDKSMARCPDGIGSFTVTAFPTFKLSNCAISVEELNGEQGLLSVYPNPASGILQISYSLSNEIPIEIVNVIGEVVYKTTVQSKTTIDVSGFSPGLYVVKSKNASKKIIITN